MNKLNENDFNLLIEELCNAMDYAGITKEKQAIVVKQLNMKRSIKEFKDLTIDLLKTVLSSKR